MFYLIFKQVYHRFFQITHLCRAAVHAGVISDVIGGRIDAKIQRNSMMLGQSTANNVSTH